MNEKTVGSPVACYVRSLPVGLERLYENVLDWERLPHVHRDSIAAISCLESGAWGWRATVTSVAGLQSLVELRLDRRARSWVTRIAGEGLPAAEIRTQVRPQPGGVAVTVDILVAAVAPAEGARLGQLYARWWARRYDADVAMMVERQRQLDKRIDGGDRGCGQLDLGPREALSLPAEFDLRGREFLLVEVAGGLRALPRRCPHQLGPLHVDDIDIDAGVVTCRWHGNRFDLASGTNLSGGKCRFGHVPEVRIGVDGRVLISW